MGHVIFMPELQTAQPGAEVLILGPEAHHAVRVKRVEVGRSLGVRNGQGLVGEGRVEAIAKERSGEWTLRVRLMNVIIAPREAPRIEVWSGVPKGDHLEAMIDGLSQAGVDAWRPLRTRRSIVDPRPAKLERLQRVCEESLKQCGRAYLLEIGEAAQLEEALEQTAGECVIVADQSGQAWSGGGGLLADASRIRVLVGPEGGWDDEELKLARERNAACVRFGPHAMRIETASVVAGACAVLSRHR